MNLFIELHEAKFGTAERRFGTGWENLFTEQLAFFLTADLGAATSLARLYQGKEIAVVGVITQPSVTHGKPDLRIEFEGGTCLHVEHKIDAPLGLRQLHKYLCQGQWFLSVVAVKQSRPKFSLALITFIRVTVTTLTGLTFTTRSGHRERDQSDTRTCAIKSGLFLLEVCGAITATPLYTCQQFVKVRDVFPGARVQLERDEAGTSKRVFPSIPNPSSPLRRSSREGRSKPARISRTAT